VLYWLLKWIFIGPFLKAVFRPEASGAENVPDEGPAILACNHLSYTDWLFMPLVIPRRVTFVAKAEYFEGRGLKGWIQRSFFGGTGQVPIDRSGGRASMAALDTGIQILNEGKLFGIYPEGTRSPDGRLYKGRTGVARIAIVAGVPVIPCAMIDTEKIQPPGRALPHWLERVPGKRMPRIIRPGVVIGKPLYFTRYAGMERDRLALRSVTDEIMYALMDLSGQEYVDMYATKAKELIRAGVRPENTVVPREGAPDTKAS
jgi:1-acyl-sn-glycerol-3-phosphate acyltransferase